MSKHCMYTNKHYYRVYLRHIDINIENDICCLQQTKQTKMARGRSSKLKNIFFLKSVIDTVYL